MQGKDSVIFGHFALLLGHLMLDNSSWRLFFCSIKQKNVSPRLLPIPLNTFCGFIRLGNYPWVWFRGAHYWVKTVSCLLDMNGARSPSKKGNPISRQFSSLIGLISPFLWCYKALATKSGWIMNESWVFSFGHLPSGSRPFSASLKSPSISRLSSRVFL